MRNAMVLVHWLHGATYYSMEYTSNYRQRNLKVIQCIFSWWPQATVHCLITFLFMESVFRLIYFYQNFQDTIDWADVGIAIV